MARVANKRNVKPPPGVELKRRARRDHPREEYHRIPSRACPTLYDPVKHPAIAQMAMANGATYPELASLIGVATNTIGLWRIQYRPFGEACKVGREMATQRVESALFQRAVGYEHEDEKIFMDRDGVLHRVELRKHVVADVGAAQFWLTNRAPEEWKKELASDNDPNENGAETGAIGRLEALLTRAEGSAKPSRVTKRKRSVPD